MRRPRVRNAVSRKRCRSVSAEKSSSSKTSASGRNEIVVPVSLLMPTGFMSLVGTPRANSWRYTLPSRSTSATSHSERVHDRDTDAVQAARDLVALAAELAAGVQFRQDDGERRQTGALLDVGRDAATAIANRDRVVGK